ncbi:hypothetical protein PC129_g9053 [Phytophthora cactorum]|uniref:Uncharacterized protein n=1 Tax=Phytophthora cactorum TaxID=29920 RepID=A0A329RG65_9STRA|nr:hypothetical protein Pcac1_g27179 [Phytophthora cactorum]KAG2807209.1 hypothetical protein PC111_g17026 [Phytophthora cactorum]KAG2823925.1 hypothetical protein PC112_g10311 [Phytophthora cactorum]KAG2850295.1 hypothetical protein PC113_g16911 [Phytophthora cactorum]KAG2908440.1 hypothetical protein PC114_g10472 [Phytophthora cactorum]
MRMLRYGCYAESLDDILGIAESTVLAYTKEFYQAVIDEFEEA